MAGVILQTEQLPVVPFPFVRYNPSPTMGTLRPAVFCMPDVYLYRRI